MIRALLRNQLEAFFCALKFLTVIPCPSFNSGGKRWQSSQGLSVSYYPLVGCIVGFLLCVGASVFSGLDSYFLPSVILLSIWVLLSGGLHLDGLADCADAWLGGLGSKEKTLAIMKDPTCGTIAVLALLLVLLLKLAAIEMLLRMNVPFWYWVLPPLLGRASIVGVMLSTPYVRSGGIGETSSQNFSRLGTVLVLGLTSLCILSANLFLGLGLLILVLFVSAGLRKIMCARLGGCTGDTLGASVELVELFVLLGLCVFAV